MIMMFYGLAVNFAILNALCYQQIWLMTFVYYFTINKNDVMSMLAI